jgi:hypothetical protein
VEEKPEPNSVESPPNMIAASSRRAVRTIASRPTLTARRCLATNGSTTIAPHAEKAAATSAIGLVLVSVATVAASQNNNNKNAHCAARVPSSGDVLSVGKITKEPATGISFPELCNGMTLAGVGVRIKYVFVKVYGVGAYFDPIAMMAVKTGTPADIEKALLDPTYPRTIRIVMNRGLGVQKFISAIVEAVEPRLKGKNLETLEEFKGLFAPVDLVEGDEVEMIIRGETIMLKTALGMGTIKSRPFTEAMCDVYFGKEPVSPTLKEQVMKGIPSL